MPLAPRTFSTSASPALHDDAGQWDRGGRRRMPHPHAPHGCRNRKKRRKKKAAASLRSRWMTHRVRIPVKPQYLQLASGERGGCLIGGAGASLFPNADVIWWQASWYVQAAGGTGMSPRHGHLHQPRGSVQDRTMTHPRTPFHVVLLRREWRSSSSRPLSLKLYPMKIHTQNW